MTRLIRKTVVLFKPETTSGTDAVPTGAANAMQVTNMTITPVVLSAINMDYISAYFGTAMSLPGAVYSTCSFTVPFCGSGTAATPPAWGNPLLGCASAETTGLLTPNRVEYLPATDTLITGTMYWYDDGLLHKMLGCFGNAKLAAKSGTVGELTFDFSGLEVDPTAVANATPVLTLWKQPVSITMANVTDVLLGATYATGALTGGTSFNSSGITLDWGNKTAHAPLLSNEKIVLSNRKIVGTVSLDLSAVQEAAKITEVKAGTTQSIGFVIGTTTGNKLMLHAPAMRLKTHKKEDFNGMRMVGFDFELDPVSGNDELRIVSL